MSTHMVTTIGSSFVVGVKARVSEDSLWLIWPKRPPSLDRAWPSPSSHERDGKKKEQDGSKEEIRLLLAPLTF